MTREPRKPRAKYLGEEHVHPIEHGEDVEGESRENDLVGTSAHLPSPDRRPEEPSGESDESVESR